MKVDVFKLYFKECDEPKLDVTGSSHFLRIEDYFCQIVVEFLPRVGDIIDVWSEDNTNRSFLGLPTVTKTSFTVKEVRHTYNNCSRNVHGISTGIAIFGEVYPYKQ